MKKIAFLGLALALALPVFAKKIKFSVDMRYEVVDSHGVHIAGDFQVLAGFPADWDPGTTPMYQEPSDTNIYSLVLDLPAFQHYEFKFVNGIFGYQQEFVPYESRVNYNFLDPRWIYLDSLADDTLEFGSIVFGGNAPADKFLLRFYVDMQDQATVSPSGVHLAGGFQGWDPAATRLYSFDGNVYEYIAYIDTSLAMIDQSYKFINGNTAGEYEIVPFACAPNGDRYVAIDLHTMLPVVCFASCSACTSAGIPEGSLLGLTAYPNPSSQSIHIQSNKPVNATLFLSDIHGRLIRELSVRGQTEWTLERSGLPAGTYLLQVRDAAQGTLLTTERLIFEGEQ